MPQKESTILVIDDTPMVISALCRILLPHYYVKVAKSGEEGIKIAKEYNVGLILLDINMPGLSGFDVIGKLKELESTRNIPIVLVTGEEEKSVEDEGRSLGAVEYIRKPFTEEIILQMAEKHTRGAES